MADIWTEIEGMAVMVILWFLLFLISWLARTEGKRKTRDPDAALKHHQDALETDREIGYREGEANQLGNIGNVYFKKGDLDTALEYYQDALKIDREIRYREGEATALRNIAIVYRKMGNSHKAQEYEEEADKMKWEKGTLEKLAEFSFWDFTD